MMHLWAKKPEAKKERPKRPKKPHKVWSDADRKFIIDNYYDMKVKEIAKHINASVNEVTHIIAALRKQGYLPERKRKILTDDEKFFIDQNFAGMTDDEMAEKLGRARTTIWRYLKSRDE